MSKLITNMLAPVNFQTYRSYTPQIINAQPTLAFGSTYRCYEMHPDNFVSCYTCLFRGDLEWKKFLNTLESNFINQDKINIINAACSDGSEAYSLIIKMKENLSEARCKKYLPIKAYDYDNKIIQVAKSGYISVSSADMQKIKNNTANEFEYFHPDYDKTLKIDGDATSAHRHCIKAKKTLTNDVKFECKNIFDILNELEDNSNTVLMFRNALGHLIPNEQLKFVELASEKLKPGSLLVIGSFDKAQTNIEKFLPEYGFTEIMQNVYRKNNPELELDVPTKKPGFFSKVLNLFA